MQPFEIFRSGNHVDASGESCAVELAGDVPEWIQLMPLGEIRTRGSDTRGPWKLSDPAAVIKASQAMLDKLPIDYDHQTDYAQATGNAAPAAGWIGELQVRDDGIYAHVEWTEKGAAAIAAVDGAIKAGKLTPAQRDWAVERAKKDMKDFETFLAGQPVIVAPGAKQPGGKPHTLALAADNLIRLPKLLKEAPT